VRTTLDIPDELYREAEAKAAGERREVKDLVNEGLRLLLDPGMREASREKALAVLDEVRRNPPYPPGKVQAMIDEANRLRKVSWE
jgi:Arc/MetJ-type ribon-helix-helix transcriptional regulator